MKSYYLKFNLLKEHIILQNLILLYENGHIIFIEKHSKQLYYTDDYFYEGYNDYAFDFEPDKVPHRFKLHKLSGGTPMDKDLNDSETINAVFGVKPKYIILSNALGEIIKNGISVQI